MPPGSSNFADVLRIVATSGYAYVAYCVVVIAWVFVVVQRLSIKAVTESLAMLPETERAGALARLYPEFPTTGMSADEFVRSRRERYMLIGFLATLGAVLLLATIALYKKTEVQKAEIAATTDKAVDWVIQLATEGVLIAPAGGKPDSLICVDTVYGQWQPKEHSFSIPRSTSFRVAVRTRLIIDNQFRLYPELIYPIGLTTTWDHRVYTVYDGIDVSAERKVSGGTFVREFPYEVTLQAPTTPGTHYILIMSGAALNAAQIFFASSELRETANSIWNLPYALFAHADCGGGRLENTFTHLGSRREKAIWPFIAISVVVT